MGRNSIINKVSLVIIGICVFGTALLIIINNVKIANTKKNIESNSIAMNDTTTTSTSTTTTTTTTKAATTTTVKATTSTTKKTTKNKR